MARKKASAPATESTVNEGQGTALGTRGPSTRNKTANPLRVISRAANTALRDAKAKQAEAPAAAETVDEPRRWHDPFNPKTGEFADNIRLAGEDDLTELRDSMKEFGFIDHFPVLADENDVVLVGHRRLKVAKELGIEPVTKKLHLGQGDAADAERLKLAIASNIGFKPMTKDDRKRIAEYLYGTREWTMERIAEALNVSARTISTDLDGFEAPSKPPRAQGGRPKGSKKPKRRTEDDFKRDIAAKKAAVPKPPPDKTIPEPVAVDEELAMLREFARFVIGRARVNVDANDHAQWRMLLDRVKAVLGSAP